MSATTSRIYDHNGWFEVPVNPISKAGVFPYLGKTIKAADPAATYMVYRPAEELANPETIASFRLTPMINDHMMLGNPENRPGHIPAEMKGVHGVIGERIFFDPADQTLYANIKVFSSSLEAAIDAGKKDLSLGYYCKYVEESGVAPDGTPYQYIQRDLRGNHGAVVDDGRCGDKVSVMDAMDTYSITFDAKDIVPMAESLKKRNLRAHTALVKSIVGAFATKVATGARGAAIKSRLPQYAMDAADEEAVASEPTLGDIADVLSDVLPQIADINAAIADATAGGGDADMEPDMEPEMDSAGAPVMDEAGKPKMKQKIGMDGKPIMKKKAPPAAPVMDDAAMDAAISKRVAAALAPINTRLAGLETGGLKGVLGEIAKRDALAGKLSNFIGTFDHSEMTLSEVAKYGAQKLGLPTMDGQEVTAINAFLHNRSAPSPVPVSTMDAADPANPLANYLKGKAA